MKGCANMTILWIVLLAGILIVILGLCIAMYSIARMYYERTQQEISKVQKMIRINESLDRWLELKKPDRRLSEYFEQNHYKTVAIYGMGNLGRRLFSELQSEGINVVFTLDKGLKGEQGLKLRSADDKDLPAVDVMVVTAVASFDEIYLDMREKVKAEIVSMEDVLWGI